VYIHLLYYILQISFETNIWHQFHSYRLELAEKYSFFFHQITWMCPVH